MPTAVKQRNSPATPKGTPIAPGQLTKLDDSFILSLAYQRFLSADYIGRLNGSSYGYTTDRCTDLATQPYAYIKICDQQLENKHLLRHIKRQFELTPLGARTVFDKFGLKPIRRKLQPIMHEHQIMSDHAMAEFRIGARESEIIGVDEQGDDLHRFALLTRDDLLKHPSMPEAGRQSPNFIPLGDTVESPSGKKVKHEIRFDQEIFVLRDLLNKKAYSFLGFEVGTGSETHRPKTGRHDHSYTESKFADFITIQKQKIYRTHFGFSNGYLLFLEPSPFRLTNMIEIWRDMTTECPQFRRYALFNTMHRFTDTYWASGRLLTEPSRIVGEDGTFTTFSFI